MYFDKTLRKWEAWILTVDEIWGVQHLGEKFQQQYNIWTFAMWDLQQYEVGVLKPWKLQQE